MNNSITKINIKIKTQNTIKTYNYTLLIKYQKRFIVLNIK